MSTGLGTYVTDFSVGQSNDRIIELSAPVPEGAEKATILGVAHVTAFNNGAGGVGFLYATVFAGNDFGGDESADYDSGRWNNLSASNQTVMDVSDEDEVTVALEVRCDEGLSLEHTRGTLNAIIVFE